MTYDYVAWLVFAVAALLVGLVAAVEVALTAVDRVEIRNAMRKATAALC